MTGLTVPAEVTDMLQLIESRAHVADTSSARLMPKLLLSNANEPSDPAMGQVQGVVHAFG